MIKDLVVVLLFTAITVSTAVYCSGLPAVEISHSTGECVKVLNFRKNDNYSCEHLPEAYEEIWIS